MSGRRHGNGITVVLIALLLSVFGLYACTAIQLPESEGGNGRVLLLLRESVGTSEKQNMLTDEAIMMKSMLEEAGFDVDIASASGRTFLHEDTTLESDLTLAEVNVADYDGFIIPCMDLGTTYVKPEEVEMAKLIAATGKPVAAQRKGVHLLLEAGALVGKRYSYEANRGDFGIFEGAIYDGNGVVQDGNIITSSYCRYHAPQDQTAELVQALIQSLNQLDAE